MDLRKSFTATGVCAALESLSKELSLLAWIYSRLHLSLPSKVLCLSAVHLGSRRRPFSPPPQTPHPSYLIVVFPRGPSYVSELPRSYRIPSFPFAYPPPCEVKKVCPRFGCSELFFRCLRNSPPPFANDPVDRGVSSVLLS